MFRTFIMGEEGTFYKAVFILGVTFTAGVIAGYKVGQSSIFTWAGTGTLSNWCFQAKELRLEYLKRKRERLAVKLQETQRQIQSMSN